MEILAPAGGLKQLNAAFAAGADAVYLGMKLYSARQGSENFSIEELKEVVKEAKSRGVKVYVALNTLIKNEEMEDCLALADEIYYAGADAIILQDYGLLCRLRGRYEEMELHASTQMSLHSLDGAKFAKDMGLNRVILARELSIEEIRAITKLGIETEVFVHGAICISYSGQCSLSSSKGGRSANRGSCAQPCRLNYELKDGEGNTANSGHLISPKEKCLLDDIAELKEAGVSSIKIEGRLRNEFYTFETVRQYKNAVEGRPYSSNAIKQIFNRGDFTALCLHNKPGHDYINKELPSNKGLFLGEVKKGKIEPEIEIELGDGISIESGGGFIVTKISDVTPSPTAKNKHPKKRVVLFPRKYKDGDRLYKSSSQAQKAEITKAIERSQKEEKEKLERTEAGRFRVGVSFGAGSRLSLRALDYKGEDGLPLKLEGGLVEEAINKPITREKLLEQLTKHSERGSQLEIAELDYGEGFLPLSKINELRREFLALLEGLSPSPASAVNGDGGGQGPNSNTRRIRVRPEGENLNIGRVGSGPEAGSRARKDTPWPALVILTKRGQLEAYLKLFGPRDVALALNPFFKDRDSLFFKDVKELDERGLPYYLQTPTIIRQEGNDLVGRLRSLKNLSGVLTGNAGLAHRLRNEFEILGDEGLNIFNDAALELFPYIPFFIPSKELKIEDLEAFKERNRLLYPLYGKRRQMIMEYCPNQKGSPCIADCRKKDFMLGSSLVKHNIYCRALLYNSEAESAWRLIETEGPKRKLVLSLVDEDYKESLSLLERLKKGLSSIEE